MDSFDRHSHWEKIYTSKETADLSWFQSSPVTSLNLIRSCNLPPEASIIDIGGGDSLLVDHLLAMGFQKITVLDISETAIAKTKARLGEKADMVNWIVADAAAFQPTEQYDLWHDRAAFHFLTQEKEIQHYLQAVCNAVKPNGHMVIGTFSEQGPLTCSGISIQQYSEASMARVMQQCFEKTDCRYIDHKTPVGILQNYIFCSFKKRDAVA